MRSRPSQTIFYERLERTAEALRQDIFAGVYPVGSFLPSEAVLASTFGMSNKSLRIALTQLAKEGLIEKIPSVGNRVVTMRTRVTLTMACPPSTYRDLNLGMLLEQFHKRYPWIRVETVSGSAIDECSKNAPADLMLLNPFQFQQLAETGRFRKLEPARMQERSYPFLAQSFTYQDTLYAQPLIFTPIILCYNKDHFREKDVPEPDGSWTWERLVEAATALSSGSDRYGLCFHLPSENRWPVFLLQSGERFEWDGGRLKTIRGTKLLEGIRLCKQLIHNRDMFPLYLSENSDEVQNLFAEGKVSMVLNNYMSMNELLYTKLSYDISPLPFMIEPRTLLVALGIAISAQSPQKEAARLVADYLSSEEGQLFIRRTTTSIPAHKQVAESCPESSGLNVPSRYGLFRETLSALRSHSDLNLSVDAYGQLLRLLKAYWSDLIQEEQLCDRLQEALSASAPAFCSRDDAAVCSSLTDKQEVVYR